MILRRDGILCFSLDIRWGFFFVVVVVWKIIDGNGFGIFFNLKLRVGYGVIG